MSTRKNGGPSSQLELPLFRPAAASEPKPAANRNAEAPTVPNASKVASRDAVVDAPKVGGAPKICDLRKPSQTRQITSASTAPSRGGAAEPGLRVIQGGGQRTHEKLASRDAVVRVLLEAGGDLLLRRISPERAGEIERRVESVLGLFDAVDRSPALMPALERQLEDLEALMRETRHLRPARRAP